MIPNWQYHVLYLEELEKVTDELNILENKLNKLGQDGWELVSFDGEIGILKRRQLHFVESNQEIAA